MEPTTTGHGHAPTVDVMDDTFIVADRGVLARRLADPRLWRAWWPRLELTLAEDRDREGVRWTVRGELTGTAEIWLERWRDGVIVHWFLRADPARRRHRTGPDRITRRYVTSFKRRVHELKDQLEDGRAVGTSRGGNPEPQRSRG